MTTRMQQGTAIGGIIFAAAVVVESMQLQFFTKLGPGPGYFPLLLGALFGGLSFVWLLQMAFAKSGRSGPKAEVSAEAKEPREIKSFVRVLFVIIAMLGVVILMDILGYQITMFLFLFTLTKFLGRQKILPTLIVALLGSVGTFYVFGKFLDLLLPTTSIPILASIGL